MNTSIKTILASTLLTVLFAGTSVFADEMVLSGKKSAADFETTNTVIEKQRVNYLGPSVSIDDGMVLSGRKSAADFQSTNSFVDKERVTT